MIALLRVLAGVYVEAIRITADGVLVRVGLKYYPPTGDAVWRYWRRR